MKIKSIPLCIAFLFLSFCYAGGYRIGLQGQKQLAMGHTGVAVINSAESVFFNPGSLTFLTKKLYVSAGVSGVFSQAAYQNTDYGWHAQTDNKTGTPFSLYAAYKINDWLSAGLGVYTPYGSRVDWPTDWSGSHLINNIALSAVFVQPTISLKVNDKLSIGGGPVYVRGSVKFNRNLSRTLTDENGVRANVNLDGKGISAWGYTLGMLFKPTDKLHIGFNYRSEIIMKAKDEKATFSNVPNAIVGDRNTTFSADLPLPAELTLGFAYTISDKWLVAADFSRTFWNAYKSLDVYFASNAVAPVSINPRNYKNSSIYKIGAQYTASDKLALRLGWYYDESPVQDGYFAPETPRPDSINFTTGFSYAITPRWAVDASLLYVHSKEVSNSYDYFSDGSSLSGTYKSTAVIPGIGISYKL